ncbi:TPA: hypothetical protein EYP38_01975, partial [Candidatus Micrarchaeota archaeon]|nr:hypothetical protein [Candidatus Micrarchaeota archaeon]
MRNLLYLLLAGMLFFGCTGPAGPADGAPEGGEPGAAEPPEGEAPDGGEAPEYMPEGLIEPSDLTYMGAFRLPEESGSSNWMWSGYGATYYPDGDPNGPDDGYPGSLFAVGHDQHQMVSEISIPAPRIADSTKDLNTAETLQPFADITGNMFGYLEIPRQGLEYLPPQGEQETGKLHFAWGQHLENENTPTHGWAELDISDPQPIGRWHLDGHSAYTTNDYMFSIPENWAAANTPGLLLATGRFRDGRWSGLGPALYAYGPWNDGNPPAP